jgi:putative transposase
MHDSPQLPNRRSVRLKTFDYSQQGAYFLTICAQHNECLFKRVILEEMILNDVGTIVHECWSEIPRHFSDVELAAHVVMPNHLHGIVVLRGRARHAVPLRPDANARKFGAPVAGSIATIARSFKSAASKRIHHVLKRPAIQVWQRNYFEHVIRNQDDFNKTSEYIRVNPARWDFDLVNPQHCAIADAL